MPIDNKYNIDPKSDTINKRCGHLVSYEKSEEKIIIDNLRKQFLLLKKIEESAGMLRDAIESVAKDFGSAEAVRGKLRLLVKAYDENVG